MAGFFGKKKQVKTRKDHKCLGCNEQIDKGSEAVHHTGRSDEDEFYNYHLHLDCHQYMMKHKHELTEGVWPGCVNAIRLSVSGGWDI